MLFSQKKGLTPIKNAIQIDDIDKDLRVALWNTLDVFYLGNIRKKNWRHRCNYIQNNLIDKIWKDYFKQPLDSISIDTSNTVKIIREYILDNAQWYNVYDFIEFVSKNYNDETVNSSFRHSCNSILEKELSAYRFVSGEIIQITAEEEIKEIEKALEISDKFKGPKIHLKTALNKLSDRKKPDYRNSIKESISAVEALAIIISKKPKAKLKDALEEIEKVVNLHPALKESFIKLYGYTSDAGGIRHALLEEEDINFEDAKFMLVSCSAFINYLIAKIKTNN